MAETSTARMDEIYRFQRHIYDATRAYYLLGRDRLIESLAADRAGASILEVACGTGRNLVRSAQLYPRAHVYGFDVSQVMLKTAHAAITKQHLADRITIAHGDATHFDPAELFGVRKMDRVFISYALSMVPNWQAVVRESARCLAPGGRLLIVDFGSFDQYPKVFQTGQRTWLKRFSVTPIRRLNAALQGLSVELGLQYQGQNLYGGYSVLAELRAV